LGSGGKRVTTLVAPAATSAATMSRMKSCDFSRLSSAAGTLVFTSDMAFKRSDYPTSGQLKVQS
jgi:hypothetical protein